MKTIFTIALVASLSALSASANPAEIYWRNPGNLEATAASECVVSDDIMIVGELLQGDAHRMSLVIDEIERFRKAKCRNPARHWSRYVVILNSTGGDVAAAMAIGTLIRNHRTATMLFPDSSCLSSCVLVLIGGVEKAITGKVGIHRPYFRAVSSSATVAEIKAAQNRLTNSLRAYVNSMDVSERLVDLMLATPPDAIRFLSESELQEFRISLEDSSHEELRIAKEAAQWNLSSSEYRKRLSEANRSCPKDPLFLDMPLRKCRAARLLDVSEEEVSRRRLKAFGTCFSKLQGPYDELFDCEIRAMSGAR